LDGPEALIIGILILFTFAETRMSGGFAKGPGNNLFFRGFGRVV
jgi:hypothetical protein